MKTNLVAHLIFAMTICLDSTISVAQQATLREISLWNAGEGGYHTYRIPALLLTQQGSVLAFCEGRKTSASDHGDIDLIMKRSVDDGLTWSPQSVVYEEGDTAQITIGNPCPVIDATTGTIWMPFTRDNKSVLLTSSTDDGLTWSVPRDLTAEVTQPDWNWVALGPGVGLQLTRGPFPGRMLIPCDHKIAHNKKELECNSHLMFSDDGGLSWRISEPIQVGGNECQLIERVDGSLLLNTRMQGDFQGYRGVSVSHDGGMTWSPIKQETQLPCPRCQASLIRYDEEWMLFCNPVSRESFEGQFRLSRERLTIRASRDDGRTWPIERVLHDGPAAYSSLARLSDGTILCLYEGGEHSFRESLRLARFDLQWLFESEPAID